MLFDLDKNNYKELYKKLLKIIFLFFFILLYITPEFRIFGHLFY